MPLTNKKNTKNSSGVWIDLICWAMFSLLSALLVGLLLLPSMAIEDAAWSTYIWLVIGISAACGIFLMKVVFPRMCKNTAEHERSLSH